MRICGMWCVCGYGERAMAVRCRIMKALNVEREVALEDTQRS